ncbi:MAG: multidrug efflux RND transporter permease subunit [Cytophagaceae bacterium]|jgi:HAE1 family hydrophobic/amphiphilic exporter-1|nr:multidrug efflux RND transporter permease subunit [Cytophagaceae bacterium]
MGKFFVERPIVAMVLSIVIILLGVVSITKLPVSSYPDITPPEIQVTTVYRGASAVSVENAVASPIEQKVNGVENMLYMKSTNANDGSMTLRVTFDVGTDMDIANMLTQNRVAQGQSFLPVEVKNEGVITKKSLSFPLLLISLTADSGAYDKDFLSNYASINLVDPLSRIPGVGQINLFGGSEYAMRIWMKPDKMASYGLSISEVMQAVKEQNTIASGGSIGAPPYDALSPSHQYTIVIQDRLKSVEEFSNIVIRSGGDGKNLRLGDVADITFGIENYSTKASLNGTACATLAIYQVPGSNALEVANTIKKEVEKIKERFPPGIRKDITLDTTTSITAGIEEIIHTLLEAVLLVILVVLLFLQDWRATIIPLLTVPVSLIGAFILFPVLGFSINNLSLLGLVLAIGIVVDDAIVVVEAVMHHIEHGLSPKEATIKAMSEISGPVIAIALILSAVFVPVAFIPGITGSLYQQFAVTIAISVAFSAINALTLSPALSALLLKPKKERKKNIIDKFFDGFNTFFGKLTDGYEGVTLFIAKKAIRGLFLIILMSGLVYWFMSKTPAGFLPQEDQGYCMMNIMLPEASSLDRTEKVISKIEKIIKQVEGVEYSTSIVGYSMLSQSNSSYMGTVFISLKPWEERRQVKQIVADLNRRVMMGVPEATVFAFEPPAIQGLGSSAGFSFVLQDNSGKDPNYLAKQSALFIQQLQTRTELQRLNTTYATKVPLYRVHVDRDKAKRMGISLSDLNTSLNSFMGGMYINDINKFGKQYKVLLQADAPYRGQLADLDYYYIRSSSGEMVPLNTMARLEKFYGPDFTNRFNMLRSAEITGLPADGFSSAQAMKAIEEMAATLPQDLSISWTNLSYQEKKAEGKATIVFAFAILMVFLILAAQYESWSLPFSVLLGTPVAIFGAFLGLWLMNKFSDSYINNIFAQISLIMLIGLAAKNAILIVEFATAQVKEGKSYLDAAMTAARLRFRPILMTALAFILGVIPLLTASGSGAEARKVMGVVVFSGMLMASIVGIMIVPSLFVMIQKLMHKDKNTNENV